MPSAGSKRRYERRQPEDLSRDPGYPAAVDFRDGLLLSTTDRGKKTIAKVWTVCEELLLEGRPITVAEVGRRLEKQFGGPKAQIIRDQPDRLKRLVDLCAEVGPSPSVAGPGKPLDSLLADIPSQTTRARVRLVVEERDQLKADLTALKKAFQRLKPISTLSPEQCYGELPASVAEGEFTATPIEIFTDEERAAVRRFLGNHFLFDEGFRIDEGLGLVSDDTGRVISPLAFVVALRKVAGMEVDAERNSSMDITVEAAAD